MYIYTINYKNKQKRKKDVNKHKINTWNYLFYLQTRFQFKR